MLDGLTHELTGSLALPLEMVCFRMAAAVALCALLGVEREMSGHGAGLRTHMLIGLAACVYALLTLQIVEAYRHGPESVRMDPIRLVEATTSGVAFLAAGTIFLSGKGAVKGLTTAAVMWVAAAIGLSVGLGLWPIALLTVVLALIISFALRAVSQRLNRDRED
jgi:putative Mg2+ transporter-C (MgtC) family protein